MSIKYFYRRRARNKPLNCHCYTEDSSSDELRLKAQRGTGQHHWFSAANQPAPLLGCKHHT